ncbi:unnamed protein product [Kuraishia capsulata CBS 1993]|uniref:AB hydrolase-1 domain-containing protein n=1 Tax=Kuraishia capsulata CBS 1993 TaxID=1382522 RepID=W6MXC8_9ASCO|nr:uncharacterized protein KUCA_T00004649001 [Kuraishia capsulata CBS 1993]CDK28665.1 unnamed protein product [Kuraishia capsulata CBS 1993]
MPFGFGFVSEVTHYGPERPVRLPSKSGPATSMKEIISKHVPEFENKASAILNPLLFSGDLQTIYAGIGNFDSVDQVYYGRDVMTYPNGGAGCLDFCISERRYSEYETSQDDVPKGQSAVLPPRTRFFVKSELDGLASQDTRPLLVLLHGLSGGSYEGYIRAVVSQITDAKYGFEAVVLNARGCALSQITTPQLFNGFWTDDVRFTMKYLRKLFPHRPFFGIGFSLGASILANYVGQESDNCDFKAVCIMADPWDLAGSAYCINRTILGSKAYSPAMTQSLVSLLKKHEKMLLEDEAFAKRYHSNIDKVKTLIEFDNQFTGPMFGFNTAMEYYRLGSSFNRIMAIRTPCLILNALDDPIVGHECLPYHEVAVNPYTLMLTTTHGGHLGYFKPNGQRWYADPVCRFFHGFMEDVDLTQENITEGCTMPVKHKVVDDRLVGPFRT